MLYKRSYVFVDFAWRVAGYRSNETAESLGKLKIDSRNSPAAAKDTATDNDWVSFDWEAKACLLEKFSHTSSQYSLSQCPLLAANRS